MKRYLHLLSKIFILVFVILLDWSATADGQGTPIITLDANTTFQTMIGWEAVSQAGESFCAGFPQYSNTLFDQASNDLGINRLRMELKTSCAMQNTCTSTTFDLDALDVNVDKVVNPLRQRLTAHGEKLWLNVNFAGRSGFPNQPDMSAYAQQVLLAYQHLQSKYGFIPDSWEIVLEPRVVSPQWTEAKIDDAIALSSSLLRANRASFTSDPNWTPYFIAPSSACGPAVAIGSFTAMLAANNNQLPTDMREFSYHRYCQTNNQELQTIGGYRTTYGINTAMLEHIGSDYEELHSDLKLAQVSAWQQFALAFCTNDDGAQYYWINDSDSNNPIINMGSRTKFLRQYFKFVRSGAVRIGATTNDSRFDPVAFINTDGKYVVVVKAEAGSSFSIQGLPSGTYGVKYTTGSQYDIDTTDVTLSSNQPLVAVIPQKGVITVYAKTASTAVAPASVTIQGPTTGSVNTPLSFTAKVSPSTASQPLTYTWQASGQTLVKHTGGLSDTVTFTWAQAGLQTVGMVATNTAGTASANRTLTLTTLPPQNIAVAGVAVTGPLTGSLNAPITFTASANPSNATKPITYTWQANEQPQVTHMSGMSDTVSFVWAVDGAKTVRVTATNIAGAASATHTVTLSNLPPTGVTITGPTIGAMHIPLAFTARVSPIMATQPITFVWEATGQAPVTHTKGISDTVLFTWSEIGDQTIIVTAMNATGTVSDTHIVKLRPPSPPTDVTIQGAATGFVNIANAFTATVSPITVTQPMTFAWQASEQTPITHSNNLSDKTTFIWHTVSTNTITVTVTNAAGAATATHTIAINPGHDLYLPIILTQLTKARIEMGRGSTVYSFNN